MLMPKVPYHTIEGDPKSELRRLKNGLVDFEKLGFASALSESPVDYPNLQLEMIQKVLADSVLWMTYPDEVTGLFVKEYFLRTVLMAANENLWETLDLPVFYVQFKNMQKVLREVFPYWIDNDYIYGLGKNMLNILKASNMEIQNEEQLSMLLKDVAILGLPPAVSVVLPIYNNGENLLQTLPKILNQTYENFELLVVDDKSDDNTTEVLKMFADDRIKYLPLEEHVGMSKARNIGIAESSYNYIAFASAEDFWDETKMEVEMAKLLSDSSAGFCYCALTYHDENDKGLIIPKRSLAAVRKEGYIYPELLRRNLVVMSSLVVKKECVDAIGGFNEEIDCFEDWEFVLRLSRNYQAAFCPETLFDVYENADRSQNKTVEEGEEAKKHFYENYEKDRILFGLNEEEE